jgi:hypothetical protein
VARRHKVKVWISPFLHRARRAGQWPPGDVSDLDRTNFGDRALMLSIVIGVFAIAVCAMIFIQEYGLSPVPTVVMALVIATLVFWLSRGVTARTLGECWPETGTPALRTPSRIRDSTNNSLSILLINTVITVAAVGVYLSKSAWEQRLGLVWTGLAILLIGGTIYQWAGYFHHQRVKSQNAPSDTPSDSN